MTLKRYHETLNQTSGQNPVRPMGEAGHLTSIKRGNALVDQESDVGRATARTMYRVKLSVARLMFGSKDRAAAWSLIADLLDSGVDDVRAIPLAAEMFKHRGKKAPAIVLSDLEKAFNDGDFDARLASVARGAESLVFANSGRVSGSAVYRGAASVLINERVIKDAVWSATAKPIALSCVLIALLVFMGLQMFPTFEGLLPRGDWPTITRLVAGLADFFVYGGIYTLMGVGVLVTAVGVSLPFLAAESGPITRVRRFLDRLPPWSFYRLQVGAGFGFAVVEIARAGGTLNTTTLLNMSSYGSSYSRKSVRNIANKMSKGASFEQAFATNPGFPDPELNALMRALASQPDALERFAAYLDRWLSDAEQTLKQKAAVINAVLMIFLTAIIGAVMSSIFGIMTAVQSGI
jgi:type II secretory pathway component PulF